MYETLKENCNYEILNAEPYTIRNINTKKKLNIRINKDGYVALTIGGKTKYYQNILAKQFIDNPNNLNYVRFKDGNHNNFSLSNLEWCSRKDIYKNTKRVRRKTNDELKQLNNPDGLSRSQLRRWNKFHGIKDYIDVKPIECDSHEFDGFL